MHILARFCFVEGLPQLEVTLHFFFEEDVEDGVKELGHRAALLEPRYVLLQLAVLVGLLSQSVAAHSFHNLNS